MIRPTVGGVALALLVASDLSTAAAQTARPEPYALVAVRLDRAEDGPRGTLLLRDGRIQSVLEADAALPPGVRVVDGSDLLALPAFVDVHTRAGCETPEPVAQQDVPVETARDVRVDMRAANRKGIQPDFRAVDVFALDEASVKAWTDQGFGALLSAPGGQLLAGASTLASVREAAARDLVLEPVVHAHAAFRASGSGYPSTLMGYHAQLRQYFLDVQHHATLTQRFEQGRPGPRPPFDEELGAGLELLSGERLLVCQANGARDIERWLRLADEFGLRIAISGGREAWKLADRLALEGVPVLLGLDWGEEVEDPDGEKARKKRQDRDAEKARWSYDEPLDVLRARRARWEETRDCALRLHEAGVAFAFGTGGQKPKDLLGAVRTLVEVGLPAEVALEALTSRAAALVGATSRLGRLQAGMDATLTLWDGDPLVDKKAEPAWVFVDGFALERERKPKKEDEGSGEGPGEGVDASGTWTAAVSSEAGETTATMTLVMEEDGSVTGEYTAEMAGNTLASPLEGSVSGNELSLKGSFSFGENEVDFELTATIAGDGMEGTTLLHLPWTETPSRSDLKATRNPRREGGLR